jgi:PadR family transcriptional regulator
MGNPKPTISALKVLRIFLQAPQSPQYGLDLSDAAGLSPGTIYPILARLEKSGWLTSSWEEIDPVAEGRRPRRYYTLTPIGHAEATREVHDAGRFLSVPGAQAWAK